MDEEWGDPYHKDGYRELQKRLESNQRKLGKPTHGFKVGDIVKLKQGKYHLQILEIEQGYCQKVKLRYLHHQINNLLTYSCKQATIDNIEPVPMGTRNPATGEITHYWDERHLLQQLSGNKHIIQPEEQTMSKYGKQTHDQIFEALIDRQYKTVLIKFPEEHARAYHYRAPMDMELHVDDKVIVSSKINGNESFKLAYVASTDEDKSDKAVAWVVQKVDTSAHEERSAQWKTLYEGIKEAEMEKKRAILADGYEKELAQYAPDAAKVLASFNTPPLENKE